MRNRFKYPCCDEAIKQLNSTCSYHPLPMSPQVVIRLDNKYVRPVSCRNFTNFNRNGYQILLIYSSIISETYICNVLYVTSHSSFLVLNLPFKLNKSLKNDKYINVVLPCICICTKKNDQQKSINERTKIVHDHPCRKVLFCKDYIYLI